MKEFKEILLPIAELLEKKNADYGDSYKKLREEYGPISFYLRAKDKMNRIEQVDKNGLRVDTESAIDTLKDIIGYATLELKYRLELSEKKIINASLPPQTNGDVCKSCKWWATKIDKEPCLTCDIYDKWESKTDKCRDCWKGYPIGDTYGCNADKAHETECRTNNYKFWDYKGE